MRKKVKHDKEVLADKEEVKRLPEKVSDSLVKLDNYSFVASKKAEIIKKDKEEVLLVDNAKKEEEIEKVVSAGDVQQMQRAIAQQIELFAKINKSVSENSSPKPEGLYDMLWLGIFTFLVSYLMVFVLPFAAVPVFVFSGLILAFSLNDLLFYSNKTAHLLTDDEKKSVSTIFLLGALIALLGFSVFANGMFVMGFLALMSSPVQVGLWVALFGIGLVLFAYTAYGSKVNRELRKKKGESKEEGGKEESEEQNEESEVAEDVDLLKLVKSSKELTWLTVIIPFLIFKAWSLNVKVIRKAKEEGDGLIKSGAILRLILLPIFAIIGLTIWLSVIG